MTSHIRLAVVDGHVCVAIDDWELKDFVEDFLAEERDLEYEYWRESNLEGRTVYTLHFPDTVNLDSMTQAIQELDPDEIERIYRLNN